MGLKNGVFGPAIKLVLVELVNTSECFPTLSRKG